MISEMFIASREIAVGTSVLQGFECAGWNFAKRPVFSGLEVSSQLLIMDKIKVTGYT